MYVCDVFDVYAWCVCLMGVCVVLQRSGHGGIKGVGENPCPTRVLVLWAGRQERTAAYTFHMPQDAVLSHWPQLGGWWTRGSPRYQVLSLGHPRHHWTPWKS